MFKIDDEQNIYTIKGDTANFKMDISPYQVKDGDTLTFTVRKRYGSEVMIACNADENGLFHIAHEDYDNVAPGYYLYDIQLTTTEGEIYTVIGPAHYTVDIEITTQIAGEPQPEEPVEDENNAE